MRCIVLLKPIPSFVYGEPRNRFYGYYRRHHLYQHWSIGYTRFTTLQLIFIGRLTRYSNGGDKSVRISLPPMADSLRISWGQTYGHSSTPMQWFLIESNCHAFN
ncbi:hypothetical protein FRC03_012867 [Tulasnella sp. 419]|nr:hypothetical protein FRC03_012867 [Tulasnella sp. 419]